MKVTFEDEGEHGERPGYDDCWYVHSIKFRLIEMIPPCQKECQLDWILNYTGKPKHWVAVPNMRQASFILKVLKINWHYPDKGVKDEEQTPGFEDQFFSFIVFSYDEDLCNVYDYH